MDRKTHAGLEQVEDSLSPGDVDYAEAVHQDWLDRIEALAAREKAHRDAELGVIAPVVPGLDTIRRILNSWHNREGHSFWQAIDRIAEATGFSPFELHLGLERYADTTRIHDTAHAMAKAFQTEANQAAENVIQHLAPDASLQECEHLWEENEARGNKAFHDRIAELCADHNVTVDDLWQDLADHIEVERQEEEVDQCVKNGITPF